MFLLLLLGLLDFGSAYNIHNDMTQLAGEAVRFAAVDSCGPGCDNIVNRVRSDADNHCLQTGNCSGATGPDQQLAVCFTFDSPGDDPKNPSTVQAGDVVTAIVETNYQWLPFLSLAKVKLRATATMRVEVSPLSGSYHGEVTTNGNCSTYNT